MQTLKEIIDEVTSGEDIRFIEYRTIEHTHNLDVFNGACRWENQELISLDGDRYSLGDRFEKYEYNRDKSILTVWEDSVWG